MTLIHGNSKLIEWGVASQALESQSESGDRHVIESFGDILLVGVVDGLGHGKEAALAAKIAIAALAEDIHDPLPSLMAHCHERLINTRGVVMTLASFDALNGTMTWLGVGSVDGVLLRANPGTTPAVVGVLLHAGVVGYQLPSLQPSRIHVTPGDTLILTTDGIRGGFTEKLALNRPPQQIADHILTQYRKETDDALVLVVRYQGATHE